MASKRKSAGEMHRVQNLQRVFIGLGSNLGDRLENLREGLSRIAEIAGVEIVVVSSVYETEPMEFRQQPCFLNLVAELSVTLGPYELLAACQKIETLAGRIRRERWGPRPLDIDLLYFGDQVIHSDTLVIPHPEIEKRRFVLVPLCEIAPAFVPPVGTDSIQKILKKCDRTERVDRFAGSDAVFVTGNKSRARD